MKSRPNPVFAITAVRTLQASLVALALHWLFRWPLTGPHALGVVFTPLLCVYFVFVFVAPWSWGLPILTHLRTRERQVALTFDDGPSPDTTPSILDILKAHGISATFFVLGEAVERHPDLLRRIVAEGHGIGLHGCRHRALVLSSWADVLREIEAAKEDMHKACPGIAAPRWFRPPHGFKTLTLAWLAGRRGCRMVAWSLNARDYTPGDAEGLTASFLSGLHPGAIALLHDGPQCHRTVEALPAILDGLAAQGYRCVLLEDDVRSGRNRAKISFLA